MSGRQAPRDDAATFDMLTERWRGPWVEPRLVESWTYEADAAGVTCLLCTIGLPEGVRAETAARRAARRHRRQVP